MLVGHVCSARMSNTVHVVPASHKRAGTGKCTCFADGKVASGQETSSRSGEAHINGRNSYSSGGVCMQLSLFSPRGALVPLTLRASLLLLIVDRQIGSFRASISWGGG